MSSWLSPRQSVQQGGEAWASRAGLRQNSSGVCESAGAKLFKKKIKELW